VIAPSGLPVLKGLAVLGRHLAPSGRWCCRGNGMVFSYRVQRI